ncbi:MAG TPA: vitamin K epoxide reductase family protein [Thermoplasmata archaeon]|nr:vitamin K epoxide reductase family protein [Thermoplasmata archaeon]
MRNRSLRSLVYFAAALGLVVSLFAAAEFFDAALRSVCSVSSFFSCALIDNSGKTTTLGIPDYLWGIGGFVLIFIAAFLAERRPKDLARSYFLLGVTSAGVVLSLWLVYVELVLIGGLCPVCLAAYLLGGAAWAGALVLTLRLRRRIARDAKESAPEPDQETDVTD